MSATRRASVTFKPKVVPYKIDFSTVAAGKTISGSKRKMVWKFGWTDSGTVHEVSLIHSIISGKKTVFEDDKKITVVNGGFNSDFNHGWQSGDHMFRVAVDLRLSEDPSYEFTIDGARFDDFQRKPLALVTPTTSTAPPNSTSTTTSTAETSQVLFGEGGGTNSSTDAYGGSFGSPATTTKPPAQAEFDFFDTSTPPVTQAASVPTSDFVFDDAFGAADPPSAPPKPPAEELLDLFSTPTPATVQTTAGASTDPFAAPPAASSRSQDLAGGFDAFGESLSTSDAFPSSTNETNPFDPFDQGATEMNGRNEQPLANVTSAPAKPKNAWEDLVDLNLGGIDSKSSQPVRMDNLHTGPSLVALSSHHPTHATNRQSTALNSSVQTHDPYVTPSAPHTGGGQQPMGMGRSGMGGMPPPMGGMGLGGMGPGMGGSGMGGMRRPATGGMDMAGGSVGGMGAASGGYPQSSGYGNGSIGDNRMGGSNMTTARSGNSGGGISSLDDLVWKK